jgi:O-antigen biosynthesis protein
MPASRPTPPSLETLNTYDWWVYCNTPRSEELQRMAAIARALQYKPLISIVVPVFNPAPKFLQAAIESAIAQAYPTWELCLADDASSHPDIRPLLEHYAALDPRIKVAFRAENGHISRCSNTALDLATGDYIALLDHDDVLAPDALYEVALLLNQHPEADMIYSDEDLIDAEGTRRNPYFKPDWCPDTFLSKMYTCHLGVYRRSLVETIGRFRPGFEGSQDYDLVLRLTEQTEQIFHIPKILYHWRIHENSVTSGNDVKPYAYEAGERAIAAALERRGEPGTVKHHPDYPGHYRVRYDITKPGRVSIIIPTRDYSQLLDQCLTSIFQRSTYPDYEVIVIDNGSVEPETEAVLQKWQVVEGDRFHCYRLDIPFNYSQLNNYAVEQATGNYLLFLNNDTEVITPDWIEAMVEQAQRSTIGAVGATLLYDDETIQHAGVVMWAGNVADHSHKTRPSHVPGYFGQLLDVCNYSAVTGACLMCRRDVFTAVGQLNETELKIACNDIDLCLKFLEQGLRNVCLPHVRLYHYESKSRGLDNTPEKRSRFLQEADYMKRRWKPFMETDPCYSIHLNQRRADYRMRAVFEQLEQPHGVLADLLWQSQRDRPKLEDLQRERDDALSRVEAMETSKFWQLRSSWFKFKQKFGLGQNE